MQKIIHKPLKGIQVACKEASKKDKNELHQRAVLVQLRANNCTVTCKTFF